MLLIPNSRQPIAPQGHSNASRGPNCIERLLIRLGLRRKNKAVHKNTAHTHSVIAGDDASETNEPDEPMTSAHPASIVFDDVPEFPCYTALIRPRLALVLVPSGKASNEYRRVGIAHLRGQDDMTGFVKDQSMVSIRII